ncbi:MAG: tetratricopeptide repeat protein [Candidatus Gastranaerophilaceae bacterium]
MRKTLLVITILGVSLVSTACINKFAVQELNNNAQQLMQSGNIEGAIARLESSIDLDETVFETHYNLAVAYIQSKKYDLALKSLDKVKELNPDFAETYHSIAVANEEKAYELINGKDEDNGSESSQEQSMQQKELSESDKNSVCNYIAAAIDNYNIYLTKKSDASDKDKVNAEIERLNGELKKYSENTAELEENGNIQ